MSLSVGLYLCVSEGMAKGDGKQQILITDVAVFEL